MARRTQTSQTELEAFKSQLDPAFVAWAEGLDDPFIQCRDMGHTWVPWVAEWSTENNCYERILRCRRCKTQRHQSLSVTGAILSSHYVYPEGYQAPVGTGHMGSEGRSALRLVSVTRSVEAGALAGKR